MTAWSFVIAAWGLTLGATGIATFGSWLAMRRAERAADPLKRR